MKKRVSTKWLVYSKDDVQIFITDNVQTRGIEVQKHYLVENGGMEKIALEPDELRAIQDWLLDDVGF